MHLLSKRDYQKKEPFRDATIILIICEGAKREPEYFKFFDGLTSNLKLHIIPSVDGRSAPNHLLQNANKFVEDKIDDNGIYDLWFILDVDRWGNHIHNLHQECSTKENWNIALSNPCFEVWLYYHFVDTRPDELSDKCTKWKTLVDSMVNGGFDSNIHPTLINIANENSSHVLKKTGYLPDIGSTDVFQIGKILYGLTKKVIDRYK